jgi:hypothetical protein
MAERVPFVSPPPPSQPALAVPVSRAKPAVAKHMWYRPGAIVWLAYIVIVAIIYGVTLFVLNTDKPLAFWGEVRGSGFTTYELLTISVLLGIFLSWRVRPFTGAWLVAEKLHPLVLMTAGVAASIHVVAMLKLDFPVQQALVPFTSSFQTGPLSLGILSFYIGVVLVLSTYLMDVIGFEVWRVAHYVSFIAWGMALGHGMGTGHDSHHAWALALYMIGVVLVVVFLAIMIVRMVSGAATRATQAAAGAA